ncbi:hypothetical protein KIPB_006079 [Kipferlia bialata]|uniref:Uncharacterized protein n=1 Tax=Kipferlia bialata TaxID=797122 RepID=A0A9K3CYB9_9EUKA|nr:hypothetical protein KIPB_006079 [Kipferlia bialata]|eukprot:g6079.t1
MDHDATEFGKPLLSYGCYQDSDGMFHHIGLISLAWSIGYPFFSDMSFRLFMQPSEYYPEFGLYSGAVRTSLYPGTFNQFLKTVGITGKSVPLIKGDSVQIGTGSVIVGYAGLPYPSCCISEEDAAVDAALVEEHVEWLGLPTGFSFDPFIEVLFDNTTGLQEPDTRAAMWDADRVIQASVGPMPQVLPPSGDMHAEDDSWFKNLSVMCLVDFEEESGMGLYFGGACEAMENGAGFTPDDGLTLGTDFATSQPEGVLCGEQAFYVESQMMVVPSWCENPATLEGQFGVCEDDRVFYSTAFASIYGGPSVCHPSAVEYIAVNIVHSVSDQVYEVTFNNVNPWTMLTDVVVLLMSGLGIQAVTETVLLYLQDKWRQRCLKKHKLTRVEPLSEGDEDSGIVLSTYEGN